MNIINTRKEILVEVKLPPKFFSGVVVAIVGQFGWLERVGIEPNCQSNM